MFELMEISEKVYKGRTPSKTTNRVDAECTSHGRKQKGRESASPTNPEKVCAAKRNKTLCRTSK